jgi:hypothetical protein
MKFLRQIFLLFIFSLFLLYTPELSARGGGGGRSGGGGYSSGGGYGGGYYHGHYYGYGGYREKFDPVATTIVVIFTIVFFSIALFGAAFLIIVRNKSAQIALKKAATADSFWDEQKMLDHGEKMYFKVQEAWSKNDLSEIQHLTTFDFFNHYQHFLSRYAKSKLRNVIREVKIDKSKIVKIIDKVNDNEDTFLMYYKGTMIDYLVNTESGIIVDGDKSEPDLFEDIYVFFRRDNKWLLNQIINDPESSYMKSVRENKV